MANNKSSWERTAEALSVATRPSPSWLRQVVAIALKDFRSEGRTRHAIVTTFAFAFIALSLVSLSVGSLRSEPALAAGLLWVILFFATIVALGRTFTKEADAHTDTFLRLNAEPTAVFLGKWLFNFALLSVVAVLTVPPFVSLMGVSVARLDLFALTVALALVAMSALGTLLGAMLAKVQSRVALLAVAAFPLFFPALVAALRLTIALFSNATNISLVPLHLLVAYAGVSLLGGLLLFEEVW